MSGAAAELRLAIAARPENLTLVRQAIAGLADAARIGETPLNDLKQIASEACMNSIVHAYPSGGPGRIDVTASIESDAVELAIRDWGTGFRPRPTDPENGSLRLGLPLIASLADSFEIANPADGGTRIVARVATEEDGERTPSLSPPEPPNEAEIDIDAGLAAKPVIARVIAVAAARAGFSIERMSDGVLIGDAIASHDPGDFAESRVRILVEECGPNLCARVGPFVKGGAERMLDHMKLPGLDASVGKLADRIEVERGDEGEFVVVELEGK